jgi:hypothetical protein
MTDGLDFKHVFLFLKKKKKLGLKSKYVLDILLFLTQLDFYEQNNFL